MSWNEKLSNELKNLKLNKKPNAKQQQRILELQNIKKGAGKVVQDPTKGMQAGEQSQPLHQASEGQAMQDVTSAASMGANVSNQLLGGVVERGAYDPQSLEQYMPQGSDQARQQTYEATYGQLTRGIGDQRGREQQSLEQRLADQGVPVGSKLYNDQMKQFGQRYDDIESNARQQATLAGNQAFEQNFNMGQTGYLNRAGALESSYSLPATIASALGTNTGSFYNANLANQLGNKELAFARSQAGRSGSGSQPAQQGFIPSMGGVAGAGQVTPQQQRPNIGQNLSNALIQGVTQGAINQWGK